jgi:hypothetical protein
MYWIDFIFIGSVFIFVFFAAIGRLFKESQTETKLQIIISDNEYFKTITIVNIENENTLSWSQLQQIKNEYSPHFDFIEVFPKRSETLNNGNTRILIHVKEWNCPKIGDLEIESNEEIIEKLWKF